MHAGKSGLILPASKILELGPPGCLRYLEFYPADEIAVL